MSGDMPDALMFGGRVAKRGAQAAGFMQAPDKNWCRTRYTAACNLCLNG